MSFNHDTKLKIHVRLSIFSSPSDKTWRETLVKNTLVTSWLRNLSISGRQPGGGCPLKGRPGGGGGWVPWFIEGGIWLGRGGMGIGFPHDSLISYPMIVSPVKELKRFHYVDNVFSWPVDTKYLSGHVIIHQKNTARNDRQIVSQKWNKRRMYNLSTSNHCFR